MHWVLPVVKNAKVEGTDEVRYDDWEKQAIVVFKVPAGIKVNKALHIAQGLASSKPIEQFTASFLKELAAMDSLSDQHRKTASEAEAKQKRLEEVRNQLNELRLDIERIGQDLESRREHLKALGGKERGNVAANSFVKRILDAEDRRDREREKERNLPESLSNEPKRYKRPLKCFGYLKRGEKAVLLRHCPI